MTVPYVTPHSIDRYRDRVDPTASRQTALRTILSIVRTARSRPRPRHWTCVESQPGSRYLYSATHPGICLVERDGAIVTLFSRSICTKWKTERTTNVKPQVPEIYRRPSPGATYWNGAL